MLSENFFLQGQILFNKVIAPIFMDFGTCLEAGGEFQESWSTIRRLFDRKRVKIETGDKINIGESASKAASLYVLHV